MLLKIKEDSDGVKVEKNSYKHFFNKLNIRMTGSESDAIKNFQVETLKGILFYLCEASTD